MPLSLCSSVRSSHNNSDGQTFFVGVDHDVNVAGSDLLT